MRTLEQQLAAYAFEKVTSHSGESENLKDKYGIWCVGLGQLVRNCGLAQALAFLNSKANKVKDAEKEAFRWLLDDLSGTPGLPGNHEDGAAFLTEVSNGYDVTDYVLATQRVQRVLVYFKRFAESVLKIDPTEREESD